MQSYSVLIYLGIDGKLRFVPQIKSDIGVYVPILEGVEIAFEHDENSIGSAYAKVRQNAINHFGEIIKFAKAPTDYKAFCGFKSQRDFDSKHYCISSYLFNSEIKFVYLAKHNGEFVNFKTDPQCKKSLPEDSDVSVIGKTILEIFEMADKAYPKLNILSDIKSDDINFSLPTNSVTLLFKKANENFYDKINFLVKEISAEEYTNDFCLISSEILSCLFENDNLKDLNLLAKECEELICFCSYSTVGSYGFFHYRNGKCLRGYLSLDESGTVIQNIGEISYAEKTLNLNFPPNDDSFADDAFDEINHDTLEKILSLMIN